MFQTRRQKYDILVYKVHKVLKICGDVPWRVSKYRNYFCTFFSHRFFYNRRVCFGLNNFVYLHPQKL